MNKKAIILLSGGMDSALCSSIAISEGYRPAALHLNYGQRTESRELEAFHNLCTHFGITEKLIVDVSHFSKIGGSSLTDVNIEVTKANLKNDEIPSSYVPFRNGNILAIAASWAEVIDAEAIFIGANQLDNSGYPDCREGFFTAFEKSIDLGTKPETHIKLITPILNYTKSDIVTLGMDLKTPFELTWSCYQNSSEACGVCDSCALRLRGFQQAGFTDPIPYTETHRYI